MMEIPQGGLCPSFLAMQGWDCLWLSMHQSICFTAYYRKKIFHLGKDKGYWRCLPLGVLLVRLASPGSSHDFWDPKRQQSPSGIGKYSNLVFFRRINFFLKVSCHSHMALTVVHYFQPVIIICYVPPGLGDRRCTRSESCGGEQRTDG